MARFDQYTQVELAVGQTGYPDYPRPIYPGRRSWGWSFDKPEAIVWHYTVGGMAASRQQLTTRLSTHFLVDRDGTIEQLVDTDDAAWTCGAQKHRKKGHWLNAFNENLPTINVEVVNMGWAWDGGPKDSSNPDSYEPYTPEQIDACLDIRDLMQSEFGIPIDWDHQVGHEELDTQTQDPGPRWPWETIVMAVKDSTTDHERWLNAMSWYGRLFLDVEEMIPGYKAQQRFELEDGSVVSAEVLFHRLVNLGEVVK